MGRIEFRAPLQPRGPAAAVVLDDAQVAEVGEGARRFPVIATVNGYTWRTSVARMGGEFLVGLNREVRQGAGVEAGDQVDVILELDAAPREVEVPPALAAALAQDAQAGRRSRAGLHPPQGVRPLGGRGQAGGDQGAPRPAGPGDDQGGPDPILTLRRPVRLPPRG